MSVLLSLLFSNFLLVDSSVFEVRTAYHVHVAIPDRGDLILVERSNPCKTIKDYCKSSSDIKCISKSASLVLEKVVSNVLRQEIFEIDETLFNDCEQILTCAGIGQQAARFVDAVLPARDCVKPASPVVDKTLSFLNQASQNKEIMASFREKHYKDLVHLSDTEKFELYRRAILLLPNSSCIVDHFGLSLMYLGREDLARKIFSQAVERQLWDHALHRPLFRIVPGLKKFGKNDLSLVGVLESGYSEIKQELLHNFVANSHLFALEEQNIQVSVGGKWTELRLKSSQGYLEHSKYFPNTIKYIKACKEDFLNIKFSALQPGTHIRPHTGPSNALLRLHLPLVHTGGARMRIGARWHHFEEGKVILFDSSWEHEVHHDGNDTRVVLILDMWHPGVPVSQRI